MVFTLHEDDSITVDRWPDRILVSVEFLEDADRRYVRRDIDGFEISVANGCARYRLIGEDPGRHYADMLWAERVYPSTTAGQRLNKQKKVNR